MKIGHLSKPWLPVPPDTYGGIERMIYYLALQQSLHHQVTVFAPQNSHLPQTIKLVSLYSEGQGDKGLDRNTELAQAVHAAIISQNDSLEIIHAHSVDPFLALVPFLKIPSVFTFYSNPTPASTILAQIAQPHTNFVFVSKNHQKQFRWIKNSHVIYQGLRPLDFPFSNTKKDYLAFIGSIADKKGILEAVEISRLCRMELIVAAKIRVEDKEFYSQIVKPIFASSPHVKFVGEVDDKTRNNILKHAKAMLFPIKWEEPFGGVMIESMIVGTPVIAFNRGPVSEIIKDGETGFIVENITQAVKAVDRLAAINSAKCRSWVERNFSIDRSASEYNRLYRHILSTKSLHKSSILSAASMPNLLSTSLP